MILPCLNKCVYVCMYVYVRIPQCKGIEILDGAFQETIIFLLLLLEELKFSLNKSHKMFSL